MGISTFLKEKLQYSTIGANGVIVVGVSGRAVVAMELVGGNGCRPTKTWIRRGDRPVSGLGGWFFQRQPKCFVNIDLEVGAV